MREESRLRQMRPRELPPVPQDGSWDEDEVGVPIEGGHEPPRRVEGGEFNIKVGTGPRGDQEVNQELGSRRGA